MNAAITHARRRPADRARDSDGDRLSHRGAADLGSRDRQRRRRRATTSTAARPPGSRRPRQPDRAAHRHHLHRYGRGRHVLLQASPPRMRPATSAPPSNEATAIVGDTQAPTRAGDACRSGSRRPRNAHVGRRDRQRRRRTLQPPSRHEPGVHADRRRTGSRSPPAPATSTRSRPAPTTTASLPRTPPATSARRPTRRPPPSRPTRRRRAAVTGLGSDRRRQHRRTSRGQRRPTTSASRDTTSTAARAPASRRRRRTGSRSPPVQRTPTPDSRSAPTTTRSPPRTRPPTSAPRPTRRPRPSPTRRRPQRRPGLRRPLPARRRRITWTAATDNVGVARYNLHRGTTSGFTPSAANRIAQPVSSPYADGGLAPGTYFYKLTAEDAAGNVGPVSNTATATVADTTAPTAPTGLAAAGGAGQAALSWTAATDNVGVSRYNVHRSTTSGFTPATANRIAQPTGTSYTDTGLATGTYYYKVTAEDAAGNVGAASSAGDGDRERAARGRARRRLRLRRGYGRNDGRPVGDGQPRLAREPDLGRGERRQVRQRTQLQRHRPALSALRTRPRST